MSWIYKGKDFEDSLKQTIVKEIAPCFKKAKDDYRKKF